MSNVHEDYLRQGFSRKFATSLHSDRRLERIERLLQHLPDFEDPSAGAAASSTTSEGGGTLTMPAICRHASVKTLYLLLDLLALKLPTCHAHTLTFYRSPYRTVRPAKQKRWHRERRCFELVDSDPSTWRRQRVVSPWVVMSRVEEGVLWVGRAWPQDRDPSLPDELLKAA